MAKNKEDAPPIPNDADLTEKKPEAQGAPDPAVKPKEQATAQPKPKKFAFGFYFKQYVNDQFNDIVEARVDADSEDEAMNEAVGKLPAVEGARYSYTQQFYKKQIVQKS